MEPNIILIVGKAAVGKSTLSNKFREDGYIIISMDDIIKEKIIPVIDNLKREPWIAFRLYKDDYSNNIINNARELFINEIIKLIDPNKKIVIEGSLTDQKTIAKIFSNINFKLYYVRPIDINTYILHIKDRFVDNPTDYGRIGFLRSADINGLALDDYVKNGINGKIINELIQKVVESEYSKIEETYNHYLKYFDVTVYFT